MATNAGLADGFNQFRHMALIGPGQAAVSTDCLLPRALGGDVVTHVEQKPAARQFDHFAFIHPILRSRTAQLPRLAVVIRVDDVGVIKLRARLDVIAGN